MYTTVSYLLQAFIGKFLTHSVACFATNDREVRQTLEDHFCPNLVNTLKAHLQRHLMCEREVKMEWPKTKDAKESKK